MIYFLLLLFLCTNECLDELLSIVFLFLTTGCKTTYNLQKSKNAHEQILEAIQFKKIIFISETHTTVFPILYITQNMEKFYEAGVRYLFLEEDGDGFSFTDGSYDNYKIHIVPQWCTYAWKYEYHLMEKEIARINQLHPEDPINVIFPEDGVVWPEDMNDGVAVLNARDEQAHKSIIEIMDAAKPEDKAIIFYGDGHGSKIPHNYVYGSEELWDPSGYYLNKYYNDQYAAFDIWHLRNNDYTKVKYGKDSNFKVLDEKYLSEKDLSAFDYFCVTDQRIYGITYPYIITDENLEKSNDEVNKENYVNTSSGTIEDAEKIVNPVVEDICNILSDWVFGFDDDTIVSVIKRFLDKKKQSFTGGMLASQITDCPGISSCFKGSLTSYSNEIKELAGVKRETIEKFGAVSKETATEMAMGARKLMNSDWAISTTGVAGPDPLEGKRPGTAWVAVAGPNGVVTDFVDWPGSREMVRARVCKTAFNLLFNQIKK